MGGVMKKYAFVLNSGVVFTVAVFEDTVTPPSHAGGSWHDVTSVRVGPGWTYDGTFHEPPSTPVQKTVTGQDVYVFLSPYWRSIYDGIPSEHAWRWDQFKTLMTGYWSADIKTTATQLTDSLDGLSALGFIPQSAVDTFLGR